MPWPKFWKKAESNGFAIQPPGWSAEDAVRLQQVTRSEFWLWGLGLGATFLAAGTFFLLSIPSLFRDDLPLLRLNPESTTRGLMALVLLLNACVAYRYWQFRQVRRGLLNATGNNGKSAHGLPVSEVDSLTGLATQPFAEVWLTKQIATARRHGKPVTVLAVGVEELEQVHRECGQAYVEETLKEIAQRLKRASRGSDLAVRSGPAEFLLLLPDCPPGEAKKVADRLDPVEVNGGGKSCTVTCTTAWVDHEPGQSAAEVLSRALQMLKLYNWSSATPSRELLR